MGDDIVAAGDVDVAKAAVAVAGASDTVACEADVIVAGASVTVVGVDDIMGAMADGAMADGAIAGIAVAIAMGIITVVAGAAVDAMGPVCCGTMTIVKGCPCIITGCAGIT